MFGFLSISQAQRIALDIDRIVNPLNPKALPIVRIDFLSAAWPLFSPIALHGPRGIAPPAKTPS
ncbi:hypothetical protein GCM10007939_09740 [Amylibacter marinus]|uniref:Uncharacterized protein n=1 Tax=Amylibacter marinus TaxID=1475483 RepID=A0ABQ5VTU8_9RHOB|nr:hypothetical protein GCM10007939_09740 [Amylibacter marinus]